jgi:hypothetical protein
MTNVSDEPWTRPALLGRLGEVREPFMDLYDAAFRTERMHRYAYWIRNREHHAINLVGSWTDPDVAREIELWRSFSTRVDRAAIAVELKSLIEKEYGEDSAKADQLTSNLELASHGFPVWNVPCQALVPQNMGPMRIKGATKYDDPKLGISYAYGAPDLPISITLYLYPDTPMDASDRQNDLSKEFASTIHDISRFAQMKQGSITKARDPYVKTIDDRRGRTHDVMAFEAFTQTSDGQEDMTALWLTPFRGRYLKARLTVPRDALDDPRLFAGLGEVDSDLATFMSMFC